MIRSATFLDWFIVRCLGQETGNPIQDHFDAFKSYEILGSRALIPNLLGLKYLANFRSDFLEYTGSKKKNSACAKKSAITFNELPSTALFILWPIFWPDHSSNFCEKLLKIKKFTSEISKNRNNFLKFGPNEPKKIWPNRRLRGQVQCLSQSPWHHFRVSLGKCQRSY